MRTGPPQKITFRSDGYATARLGVRQLLPYSKCCEQSASPFGILLCYGSQFARPSPAFRVRVWFRETTCCTSYVPACRRVRILFCSGKGSKRMATEYDHVFRIILVGDRGKLMLCAGAWQVRDGQRSLASLTQLVGGSYCGGC